MLEKKLNAFWVSKRRRTKKKKKTKEKKRVLKKSIANGNRSTDF